MPREDSPKAKRHKVAHQVDFLIERLVDEEDRVDKSEMRIILNGVKDLVFGIWETFDRIADVIDDLGDS